MDFTEPTMPTNDKLFLDFLEYKKSTIAKIIEALEFEIEDSKIPNSKDILESLLGDAFWDYNLSDYLINALKAEKERRR